MSFFSKLFKGKQEQTETKLSSPIKGSYVALENVNDPVFSAKTMGDGFAVRFSEQNGVVSIYAPVSGTIDNIFPTKHAIAIVSEDKKSNILVHIGIDTVTLDGQGFELFVSEKQKVQTGDLLAKVDLDFLKSKNIISDVLVLVLPDSEKQKLSTLSELKESQEIEVNQPLFFVN